MRSFDKPLVLIVALAAAVAACSGSSSADPTSDMTGSPATPAPQGDGEFADKATIEGAVSKLATLDAFSYEMILGTRSTGEDYSVKITGVEHPLAGDRAQFGQTNHGVEWSSMSVGGEYFGDIGRGLEPLDPREDARMATDPNWVGNLMTSLSPQFDDFVLVGNETLESRPVKHYALDEYGIGKLLTLYEDEPGFETFTVELWIDTADGYLSKAHVGRLPFATNDFTSMTEWHFQLSDVGCDCPITAPTVASTPVPATPEPTATPVVAPKALACGNGGTTGADIEWTSGAKLPEPVDQIKAWTGVLSTDVMAFDGMRIVLLRGDAAVAEWTFDAFGRPFQMQACQDAGIDTVPPEF